MSESLIKSRIIGLDLIMTLFLSLLFIVGGFSIGQIAMPVTEFNLIVIVLVYACLPIITMFLGLYIGWHLKSNSVEYTPPEWNFEPLGLTLDECSKMIRNHNKKYFRVIAYSNYWFFLLPPILAIAALSLPFYSFYEDTSLQGYVPIAFATLLLAIFLISEYGSYRASSNAASKDFTLPLIRESIKLAKTQSKVEGISKILVVLDHAAVGDFHVYENPRVVARVTGTEKGAYLESKTEDIGAIDSLLIHLDSSSSSDQINWWWQSRDRTFRKYVGDDKEGYYVRSPVPSLIDDLGVKDVKLVTENAIAILLLEWIQLHGRNPALEEVLTMLGVNLI